MSNLVGKKLIVKKQSNLYEIVGFFPKGQANMVEDHYKISDGQGSVIISKNFLNEIFEDAELSLNKISQEKIEESEVKDNGENANEDQDKVRRRRKDGK